MDEPIDTNGPAYLGGFLDAMKMRDDREAKEREPITWLGDGGVWRHSDDSGIPITVTQPSDPAYQLLMNPGVGTTPTIYKRGCYICEDPEFAMMGLPLCSACELCGGHIAADDVICDDCGREYGFECWQWEQEPGGVTSPYYDLSVDECWP